MKRNLDLIKHVNNEKYKVKLIRNKMISFTPENNRTTYKEVEPGIFYINAGYIDTKQFENLLPKLLFLGIFDCSILRAPIIIALGNSIIFSRKTQRSEGRC